MLYKINLRNNINPDKTNSQKLIKPFYYYNIKSYI